MAENNLFPEGYEDEIMEDGELEAEEAIGYKPGVAFDYSTGDFIRDGRNRLLEASGVESWQQWCKNCLQTERYKHLAYSSDFGIELDAVFSAETREEAESILTRQINEAILADPYGRAAYIDGLDIEWTAPDAVQVDLTIVGIDDVTIDVTAYITEGEA